MDRLILSIVILSFSLLCCGCKRERSLPNGYKLTYIESVPANHYLILDGNNDCVVPDDVTRIGEYKQLVFGVLDRTKPVPGMAFHDPMNVVPGFFVLDTERKTLESGLMENEFLSRMRRLGVNSPKLRNTKRR